MLSQLPAADALALLHAELGAPPLTSLESGAGARTLRAAVAESAAHLEGGLLALLAADGRVATMARTWLATGHGAHVELQALPVAEGVLVLAHVGGDDRHTPSPQQAPSLPMTAPDAAPVPGAGAHDLDDALLRRLLRARLEGTGSGPTTGSNEERYLARYGLLTLVEGRFRPTVAGLLVAAVRPELHLPGCRVEGTVDDEPFLLRGPIPALVGAVEQGRLGDADPNVLAEAVANALLHRDWTSEEPVRLSLAGERLEVRAPGWLPAGASRGQRAARRSRRQGAKRPADGPAGAGPTAARHAALGGSPAGCRHHRP